MALLNEESLVPNSHKFKQENTVKKEKNIKKVAQGKIRKKSLWKKFSETFIKSDIREVKDYIFFDVLVPEIVETFREIIISGFDMFLHGDARRSSRNSPTRGKSYVSYKDFYSRKEPRNDIRTNPRRSNEIYKEVTFETKKEADDCVEEMLELLDRYETVSLREFYEIAGVNENYYEFTDENYGWTNLSGIRVIRVRGEWIIDNLPRPVPIINTN